MREWKKHMLSKQLMVFLSIMLSPSDSLAIWIQDFSLFWEYYFSNGPHAPGSANSILCSSWHFIYIAGV